MNPSELTFVVQGPVIIRENRNLTAECLTSIRRYFPGSMIILSTDVGTLVDKLNFDLLVFNSFDEPNVIENDQLGNIMPANLQGLSTLAGLLKVETAFVVKIRSDMVLKNNKLLTLLENRPSRTKNSDLTLTQDLVIVLNWSTVDPRQYLKLAHHPSDHLYAGNTEDVVAIWKCEPYPVNFMRWFENHEYPQGARHGHFLCKYRVEGWIWYNFVKNYTKEPFENSYAISDALIKESLALMVHNLMVVTPRMAGTQSLKNPQPSFSSKIKMMTYFDWVRLSRSYGVSSRYKICDFESLLIKAIRLYVDRLKRIDFVFPDSNNASIKN